MKKAFLLAALTMLTVMACGKSDDNNGNGGGGVSTGKFLPPKWIQGSWTTNDKKFGYAFKTDDF